jgi:hypothetical protein
MELTSAILELYIWGFLAALNWIFVWQVTTLKVHFLQVWLFVRRVRKKVYTPSDFEDYVFNNWGLLGELLCCPICLSHWTGAVFSGSLCYFFNGPIFLPIIAFFTYPVLIYFLIRKYIS